MDQPQLATSVDILRAAANAGRKRMEPSAQFRFAANRSLSLQDDESVIVVIEVNPGQAYATSGATSTNRLFYSYSVGSGSSADSEQVIIEMTVANIGRLMKKRDMCLAEKPIQTRCWPRLQSPRTEAPYFPNRSRWPGCCPSGRSP